MSLKKKLLAACLFLLLASLAFGVFADIPASSTFVNKMNFTVNRHNNLHQNGALINLWQLNHNPSQDWYMMADGTIRSASNPNYCLNIHNYSLKDGAVINLWQCNGNDSQKWSRVGTTLRPQKNTKYCLNLHNYDNKNNATINLWSCNGHDSQYWKIITH
ncbi:MAG: RICIN domain-containing protein [Deltaproteobacteria bacterium]|nr:RICIN domain-containing protein [Deltaproteobacteria bacterium]